MCPWSAPSSRSPRALSALVMRQDCFMESRSLWLVRHGQASFGKSDYDNLSETGHEQAYVLGKDLAHRGITPSLIVSGSMKRHRQTLAEIAAGAGWTLEDLVEAADIDQPGTDDGPKDRQEKNEPATRDADISASHAAPRVPRRVDARWNELDHRALLTAYKPAYKNMLVLKADMMRTLRPRIAFEETFERAVDRWSCGDFDHDYPESFSAFTTRVGDALSAVVGGSQEHTLVVTSAGPVCWTMSHLVAGSSLDAWKHFTLAAVNTGVTRITIDRHGPHVLTFNEFAHLDGPGLVTNR